MTLPESRMKELREKAEAVRYLFPTRKISRDPNMEYECPACEGNGTIDGDRYESQGAADILVTGIGDDLEKLEAFTEAAANPATVLSLLDTIEVMRGALELARVEMGEQCSDKCESESDRAAGCQFDTDGPCAFGVAYRAVCAAMENVPEARKREKEKSE